MHTGLTSPEGRRNVALLLGFGDSAAFDLLATLVANPATNRVPMSPSCRLELYFQSPALNSVPLLKCGSPGIETCVARAGKSYLHYTSEKHLALLML